jgi:hypothetical protein
MALQIFHFGGSHVSLQKKPTRRVSISGRYVRWVGLARALTSVIATPDVTITVSENTVPASLRDLTKLLAREIFSNLEAKIQGHLLQLLLQACKGLSFG